MEDSRIIKVVQDIVQLECDLARERQGLVDDLIESRDQRFIKVDWLALKKFAVGPRVTRTPKDLG